MARRTKRATTIGTMTRTGDVELRRLERMCRVFDVVGGSTGGMMFYGIAV